MVRLAILLVLFACTLYEWYAGPKRAMVYLALTGLFVFFSLRYGQGTDYLTYLSIYANVPSLASFPAYQAFAYNKIEIGFFYIISAFKMVRAHYAVFIAFVTLFSLYGLHRFIKWSGAAPMFALMFFFAVYSLVYMESAIRQMLSIGVALGFVLPGWAGGKRIRPLLGILLASLIHTSAALLFLLPVLFWNERPLFLIGWDRRKAAVCTGLLLLGAAAAAFVDFSAVIRLLPERFAKLEHTILSYYLNRRIGLLPFLNRSLFMLAALALAYRARERLSGGEKLLFNLYCVGYGVYLLMMSSDLIASRTTLYFRIVEFCLFPALFYRNRDLIRRAVVAMPAMLALLGFLYVKDIAAAMGDAQYYSRNPLRYPYITVLSATDLLDHKFVNVKNAQAMNAYQAGGVSYDEYYRQLLRKPSVRSPILPY